MPQLAALRNSSIHRFIDFSPISKTVFSRMFGNTSAIPAIIRSSSPVTHSLQAYQQAAVAETINETSAENTAPEDHHENVRFFTFNPNPTEIAPPLTDCTRRRCCQRWNVVLLLTAFVILAQAVAICWLMIAKEVIQKSHETVATAHPLFSQTAKRAPELPSLERYYGYDAGGTGHDRIDFEPAPDDSGINSLQLPETANVHQLFPPKLLLPDTKINDFYRRRQSSLRNGDNKTEDSSPAVTQERLASCWRIQAHFNLWARKLEAIQNQLSIIPAPSFSVTVAPQVRDCIEVAGSIYWRLEYPVAWRKAQQNCELVSGATLVSIHSFAEKQLVYDLAISNAYASSRRDLGSDAEKAPRSGGVWIGLHQQNGSQESIGDVYAYRWTDHSLLDYSDWLQADGENHPIADRQHGGCVKISHATYSTTNELAVGWDNANCELELKAICKLKLIR